MFQDSPLTNALIKKRLKYKQSIDAAFRIYWQYFRVARYNSSFKSELVLFNTENEKLNYEEYKDHCKNCNCNCVLNEKCSDKCKCLYNNNCDGFKIQLNSSPIFTYILNDLLLKCKISSNTLFRIIHKLNALSGHVDKSIFLSNIVKNPFNFLNEEYQLLTLKKCESIVELYKLTPTHVELGKAFIFSYFLKEKNTHYIKKENFTKYKSKHYLNYIKRGTWFVYDYLIEDIGVFFEKYNITTISPSEYTIIEIKFEKPNGYFDTYYTTKKFLQFEKNLSDQLVNLYYNINECIPYKTLHTEIMIDNFIKKEDNHEKPFTGLQKEAIKKAITSDFSIIEGLPGAGKSTIINAIAKYFDENNEKVCLMAPTAKAVKSLTEKIEVNSEIAGTVHKFVYDIIDKFNNYLDHMDYNEEYNYEASTKKNKLLEQCISYYDDYEKHPFQHIIVDEAGMLDIYLFEKIVDFAETFGATLLLVGDCNQLPPIGIGKPYYDIIQSTLFYDSYTYLNKIQRNNGPLSRLIIDVLNNRTPQFNNNDVKFIEQNNLDNKTIKKILLPFVQSSKFIKNTYIITAQNGDDCSRNADAYFGSVNQINTLIQKITYNNDKISSENDILHDVHNKIFNDGDRIVRIKNDYEGEMRANGEISILTIIAINGILQYHLDNYDEPISYKTLQENFILFYGSTVHKMQGSESEKIIVIVSKNHQRMWNGENGRELIYTALSRPKKELIVIGNKETFDASLQKRESKYKTKFMVEFSEIEL